jgi:hypothetical protein
MPSAAEIERINSKLHSTYVQWIASERLADEVLSLRLRAHLPPEQVDAVCAAIAGFFDRT